MVSRVSDLNLEAVKLTDSIKTAITEKRDLSEALSAIEIFLFTHKKDFKSNSRVLKDMLDAYQRGIRRVANDLTAVSRQVFLGITDCTNINEDISAKKIEKRPPQSHVVCGNFSTNLYLKVAESVLAKENIDERTLIMERWIAILKRTFNKHDYLTASAILQGINHAKTIMHLRNTKAGLSPQALMIVSNVENYLLNYEQKIYEGNKKAFIPTLQHYKKRFINLSEKIDNLQELKNNPETAQRAEVQLQKNLHEQSEIKSQFLTIQQNVHTDQVKRKKEDRPALFSELTASVDPEGEKKLQEQFQKIRPAENASLPSSFLTANPEIVLPKNAKLLVNKNIQNSILLKDLKAIIPMTSGKIRSHFFSLEQNLKEKIQNSTDTVKIARLQKILRVFAPLNEHGKNSYGNGPIKYVDAWLQMINAELKPSNSPLRFPFVRGHRSIVATLMEIKGELIKQKEAVERIQQIESQLPTSLNNNASYDPNNNVSEHSQASELVANTEKESAQQLPTVVENTKLERLESTAFTLSFLSGREKSCTAPAVKTPAENIKVPEQAPLNASPGTGIVIEVPAPKPQSATLMEKYRKAKEKTSDLFADNLTRGSTVEAKTKSLPNDIEREDHVENADYRKFQLGTTL